MRSRLYFQFALGFQFPSANEKKILFKTIYSSFFVICDRKQSQTEGLLHIRTGYHGLFFFFCFIDPAESAYLRIPSKKLLMALVYNHLKRGVKQKRQVPMVIMVLGFKIKTSRCKNKKLSFEKNNPPVALKLGIFIYTLKKRAC